MLTIDELRAFLSAEGLPALTDEELQAMLDEEDDNSVLLAELILLTWTLRKIKASDAWVNIDKPEQKPAGKEASAAAFLPVFAVATAAMLHAAHAQGTADYALATPAVDYLIYKTVGDERVRLTHRTLEGVCLPKGDAWWNTHYPPNGWRCRCKAIPATKAQVKASKGLVFQAPQEDLVRWESGTGEILELPASVEPGFHLPPGDRKGQLGLLLDAKKDEFARWRRK